LFNLREGFDRRDDTLPSRLLQAKEKLIFRSYGEKQLTLVAHKEDNIFLLKDGELSEGGDPL